MLSVAMNLLSVEPLQCRFGEAGGMTTTDVKVALVVAVLGLGPLVYVAYPWMTKGPEPGPRA